MRTYPWPFIRWGIQLHHLPPSFSHHQCCSLPHCSFALGKWTIIFLCRSPTFLWPTPSLLSSCHLLQQLSHHQCQLKFACWERQSSHLKLSSRRGLLCHPHPYCYRCLGLPTFFLHSILSTKPLPMGYDNQQQRDLLGDLGPVYRWQCSKHCFLKDWVYCFSSFPFPFHFQTFYIFISLNMPYTALCHYAYTLVSAWLTHLPFFIIMLTPMCHFCLPP